MHSLPNPTLIVESQRDPIRRCARSHSTAFTWETHIKDHYEMVRLPYHFFQFMMHIITFLLLISLLCLVNAQVTIPLSEPTPAVPLPQATVINGVTVELPKMCARVREFYSCTARTSNEIAGCQQTFPEVNADFYACLCGGMQKMLPCYDMW